MTNNAKAILITILGVSLACVVVAVLMAAVVMFSLIAIAGGEDEEKGTDKPSATKSGRQRVKPGIELNDSKEKPARETEYSSNSQSLAPELVGKWHRSHGGGEVDFTGKSRYRSHRSYFYEFSSDGSVEYLMERETLTIMQCEIKERRTASGKASTSGDDALTINFGESDLAGSNSCEGGDTVEKTLPAETVNLKWRLKTGNEQTQLCFDEADGEACYDKKD